MEASPVLLPQALHIHICSHFKRRSLKKKLQVGVLQVALVTLGRHIGLLNNWYCLPEENEVSDKFYKWIKKSHNVFSDSHRLRPFSFVNVHYW